ncbi:Sensor histidine kinase TmoS [compost metagenome]
MVVVVIRMLIDSSFFVVARRYLPEVQASDYAFCLVLLSATALLWLVKRKSGESLRRSRDLLLASQRVSNSSSVIFHVDEKREISWRSELSWIFEYPGRQLGSIHKVLNRIHPDDRHRVESFFERIRGLERAVESEHRLVMPDGRIKFVRITVLRSHVNKNKTVYVGAMLDITAAKRAEEALLDSQAQLAHVSRVITLGELAASIAHEVNQPLAAIMASGESGLRWLDRPEPNLDELRKAFERVVDSAGRAAEFVSSVRSLARKMNPQRTIVSFDTIVSDAVALVTREMISRRIRFQLEKNEQPVNVFCDNVQLQQVIINLVVNACQAMDSVDDRPRVLVLRTWTQGDQVTLEVSDSGIGIEEAAMPSLFNPFFTTKAEGLGIGLSICRSIVDWHGGKIWASSKVGQGSSFFVALPIARQ